MDDTAQEDGAESPHFSEESVGTMLASIRIKPGQAPRQPTDLFGRADKVAPTLEMNERYGAYLQESIPEQDLDDIGTGRQFEPEYAQGIYVGMLEDEYAMGDYLEHEDSPLQITSEHRQKAILLMTHMTDGVGCRAGTLYVAASIMDRFLINLASAGQRAPCLVTLGLVSVLIAAKLEDTKSASLRKLAGLLSEGHGITVHKRAVHALERQVLTELDFGLTYATPLTFLERYQRIFDLDITQDHKDVASIAKGSKDLCFYMLENSKFLNYRPSQIAAVSLLLAIKMRRSKNVRPRRSEKYSAP